MIPNSPFAVSAPSTLPKEPKTPAHAALIKVGHFLFGHRNYLFPLTFCLFTLTTDPGFLFGSERVDRWMNVIGIIIISLGLGCRVLAIGCVENIRRGGRQKRIMAHQLIRTGFFAHSRNPLYLGNLLIVCGFVLIANSLWWYLLLLPGFLGMYYTIVLAEEDFLAQKFGQEYVDYCRAVRRRFIPTLTGLFQSLASCGFDWKRVMRKEYGAVCTAMAMTLFLLIWERWEHYGYITRKAGIQALVLLLFVVLILYGGVLWLKARGKLRS